MSKISLDPKVELELVNLAKKSKENFAPLYKHYYPYILKYIKVRLSDQTTAEDLTAKIFEKALKGIENFQWQGISFSAWIYRIAKNTLVDYFRETEKKHVETYITEETIIAAPQPTPDKEYEEEAEHRVLYKVLNDLPSRERDIVYMKFFDGYTNRIIANITGLSETNIGTIIYRAIKDMRDEYSKL